jgi:hypothetical protein
MSLKLQSDHGPAFGFVARINQTPDAQTEICQTDPLAAFKKPARAATPKAQDNIATVITGTSDAFGALIADEIFVRAAYTGVQLPKFDTSRHRASHNDRDQRGRLHRLQIPRAEKGG